MSPRFKILPNKLKVVLAPCEAQSAAIGYFVSVGSRYEPEKLSGISHFIEHMLFKGTPTRRAIDITRAIEGRGGVFNAYTSEETTCYYAHLPSEYTIEAIDILSDMFLNALIADNEFALEKNVIIEEIKMYEDDPSSVAMETMQSNLFPCCRLGSPVAGTIDSLQPLTSKTLRSFVKSNYTIDNLLVVVAGSYDKELVLKKLSSIKCHGKARKMNDVFIDFPKEKPIEYSLIKKDINQVQLALGYKMFGFEDDRRFAVTLLDAVLGRGMSSRLFQEIREKRALSYDISSRATLFEGAGIFSISSGMHVDKAAQTLKVIDKELRRICQKRVSANELSRTKEFIIGNFKLSHERITTKMFSHASSIKIFGKLVTPEEQVECLRAVTSKDIFEVANEIFDDKNRSVSWVVPNFADESNFPR
jgi:predicted Zn-dependent peptidase